MPPSQCRQCHHLQTQLLRLEQAAEQQAAADAEKCHDIFEQMQRLVELNASLIQRKPTTEPHNSGALATLSSATESSRVERLQATVVEQERELDRLRRQLQSMVPMLPLDDGLTSTERDYNDYQLDDQAATVELQKSRLRGRQTQPITSLCAQLKNRDATIHRLQQHVADLAKKVDKTREKRHRTVAEYQQTTRQQQMHLKKYAAQIREQARSLQRMDKQLYDLQQYVNVLETKLLTHAASRQAAGLALTHSLHQWQDEDVE